VTGLAQGALANALPSDAMGAVSGATQLAGMAGQVVQGGVGQALSGQAVSLAKGALASALPSGAGAALSQANQLGAAAHQVGALAQAARSAVPALKVL
jgi:type VI secretion system secreted protein VgrG